MCWDMVMTFSAFNQRIPNSFETINLINRETSGAIRIFDITKNGHKRNSSRQDFIFPPFYPNVYLHIVCVFKNDIHIYIYTSRYFCTSNLSPSSSSSSHFLPK